MQNVVIVTSSVNIPEIAAESANTKMRDLGKGWRVVSSQTTTEVFGVEKGREMPPIHHAVYTLTVTLEKPDGSEEKKGNPLDRFQFTDEKHA